MTSSKNSYSTRTPLKVDGKEYQIFSLAALGKAGFKSISRLPFSLKVLLENLLRHEDDRFVRKADIEALANRDVPTSELPL